jgi:uroporphyrinogen decarboxylase
MIPTTTPCVCFFCLCVFYFFSKRGADIISVDQTVSMDDALKRLKAVNPSILVQGNLDPTVLLSNDKTNIKLRTEEILKMTGGVGHVMNLGHGVESNTSEENVQYFVETVRNWKK